jgi:capsular exopolysaccharide synthesis family protein
MAQTGAKVILIDADLRNPTQDHIFECDSTQGLTTILAGFNDLGEVIKENIRPNLALITSGPAPPNPSELLGSERMAYLIEKLSGQYDYVFIDAPPANIVADAAVVASKTAAVILVAKHGATTYANMTKAVSGMELSGASILGFIINDNQKGGE